MYNLQLAFFLHYESHSADPFTLNIYEGSSVFPSLDLLWQSLALTKRGSFMVSHSLSHNSRFLYRSSQLRSTQGMNSLIKRLDRKCLSYLKHNRTCTWMDFGFGAFLCCFLFFFSVLQPFGFMHPPSNDVQLPPIIIIIIIPLSFTTVILASALIFFLKYIFNQWEVFLFF